MKKQSSAASHAATQSPVRQRRSTLANFVLVLRHFRARDLGKAKYGSADKWLELLLERVKPGELIPLPDGTNARVNDLYASTNKVYRAHVSPRYELEIVKEKKPAGEKRTAKGE